MAQNGGVNNGKDISAEEKTKTEGTRLQKENENCQWQEGITKTQAKGKKSAFSVRPPKSGLFL